MQVALSLGLLVIILLIILALLGSLIGGIILTILTVRRDKKRKAQGMTRDTAQILMTVGCVLLLAAPVFTGGAILVKNTGLAIKRAGYKNFTDRWKNEYVLGEPRKESIEEMLRMAEAGDADGLYASFAQADQGGALRDDIDSFLANYPKGLAAQEFDISSGASGGNGEEETFSCSADIIMDGRYYYIYCSGCFRSTNESKIGITDFNILSQETSAYSRPLNSELFPYKDIYCFIEPPQPVDAVVISSNAYIRNNVNEPIPYDEALRAVKELSSPSDYVEKFGEPDVRDENWVWYWSVEPDGDMPRYIGIYPSESGVIDRSRVHIDGRDSSYRSIWFDTDGNIKEE